MTNVTPLSVEEALAKFNTSTTRSSTKVFSKDSILPEKYRTLETMSAQVRMMAKDGFSTKGIQTALEQHYGKDIRYQQIRNMLKYEPKK